MIKRILVGLGGTPYTQAEVHHAIDLAQAHQAEITAITIVDLERVSNVGPVPIGGGSAATELVQHRLEAARQACQEARELMQRESERAGVRCHLISEAGDPLEEMCSLWRYHDLTILSLRGLFEYGIVHDPMDMAIRIIGRGVRPIIAVGTHHGPVKKVLFAYNGSMESAKAMKQFVQYRPWSDITARIVCFEKSEDEATPLLNDAEDYLQAHGITTDTLWSTVDATDGLDEQIAEWSADLVVIGSTTRSRFFRFLLGDTAMHMIKTSQVPVFMSQ